jgi:hypothetical protein
MPNLRIALLVALAFLIGACARPASTPDDEFSRFAARVESEIRIAEKAGFLWRDTDKLMQDARAAQREGRYDDAMKLANQALRQAQLAQQQARKNANAGPAYPHQ